MGGSREDSELGPFTSLSQSKTRHGQGWGGWKGAWDTNKLWLEIQHYQPQAGWPWDDYSGSSEKLLEGHTPPREVTRRLSWNSVCRSMCQHCTWRMVSAQEMAFPIIRTSRGNAVLRDLVDKGSKTCAQVCKGAVTVLGGRPVGDRQLGTQRLGLMARRGCHVSLSFPHQSPWSGEWGEPSRRQAEALENELQGAVASIPWALASSTSPENCLLTLSSKYHHCSKGNGNGLDLETLVNSQLPDLWELLMLDPWGSRRALLSEVRVDPHSSCH